MVAEAGYGEPRLIGAVDELLDLVPACEVDRLLDENLDVNDTSWGDGLPEEAVVWSRRRKGV